MKLCLKPFVHCAYIGIRAVFTQAIKQFKMSMLMASAILLDTKGPNETVS